MPRKTTITTGTKTRTIYVPSDADRLRLDPLVTQIARRVDALPTADVIHGFRRRRSPVTMAQTHVGHAWTVCMDLKDFFPSCTRKMLEGKLAGKILDEIIVDNHCAQGLPTSPAAANLAASPMDVAILRRLKKHQVVYTRYADDMTFSGDDESLIAEILRDIPRIVSRCGFRVHPRKTHVYRATAGRRVICGVSVGDDDIRPTRKTRRRLRAAQHRLDTAIGDEAQTVTLRRRVTGLAEWCKLTPPRERSGSSLDGDSGMDMDDQIRAIAKVWKLGMRPFRHVPDKGADVDVGESCIITGDPVMMIGMSTYTTGWTSCMSHPSGSHRRGVGLWALMPGTRLAALLDTRTSTYAGVERPRMRARCLVHELHNRRLVYDRLYGGQSDTDILRSQLVAHGVISIAEARGKYPGEKVVGHVPAVRRPYADSLRFAAATGTVRGKKVKITIARI